MNISTQIKLTKDEYAGFYSCGLTMADSATMQRFTEKFEGDNGTVMKSADGLSLTLSKTSCSGSCSCAGAVEGEGAGPDETFILQSVFENNSKTDVTLEMIDTFSVSGIEGDKVHRFLSYWSAEGRHRVESIAELNMEHSWGHMAYRVEKFGNVGSMPIRKYFPFVAIEDSKTGRFTAFMLYAPSSWQIEIITRHDDLITVNGGIADRDFGHFTSLVKSGSSFTTPRAIMACGDSLYDVCDKILRAQKPNISPADTSMGIVFNEYCATWGDPTEEKMLKIADRLQGEGIQYLVMDSGWYLEPGERWWDFLGKWDVSQTRFPHGFKYMTDYIRSKGMIPGIWFEPEVLAPSAPVYNMPEHLVKKDGVPLSTEGRRYLDMEDPWVKEHLASKVTGLLKNQGFGYVKVDYNDSMGIGCDGPDSLGENLRRKVLATQDFHRSMRLAIPDLVIENCSAGGHRLDPSFMELCSMASFSDAHEITALPIVAANLQLLIKPSQSQIWAVIRPTDDEARMHFSLCATLLGRMGLSGDVCELSDSQWSVLRSGIAFYKDASDIICSGKTIGIHQTSVSYNNPIGEQLVVRVLPAVPAGPAVLETEPAVPASSASSASDGGDSTSLRALVVFHRFEDSISLTEYTSVLSESGELSDLEKSVLSAISKVTTASVSSFGEADGDFTAQAFIVNLL